MKLQKIFLFGLLALISGLLSACNFGGTETKDNSINLITTFAPLYSHTKSIVQDNIVVNNLVEIGKSVHNRQLTPYKAAELENANGIIINGVNLEEFLEKYLGNAQNTIILDTSKGIDLLKFNVEDEHDDNNEHLYEDEDKSEHDHDHGERDPHVWLNPENAIIQTNNILAGLKNIDPINYNTYKNNAEVYISKINNLDEKIKQNFKNTEFKNFIVFHNAYSYFFDHYNLTQYQKNVIQNFEGETPSIKEIQDFIKQIDEEDVKIIFTEPQFSPKIVTMLKEEKPDLVIQEIDPIGKNLSANNYIENLELLSNNIIKAMSKI